MLNDRTRPLVEQFVREELKQFSDVEKQELAYLALTLATHGYSINRPEVIKYLEHLAHYGHFLQGLKR